MALRLATKVDRFSLVVLDQPLSSRFSRGPTGYTRDFPCEQWCYLLSSDSQG